MNHTERADESRETEAAAGSILRALGIFALVFIAGLTVVLYVIGLAIDLVTGM